METKDKGKEVIPEKYRGKGKQGLFCPFRQGHFCNKNCGLFCEGLGSCTLHAINLNLQRLTEAIKNKKETS